MNLNDVFNAMALQLLTDPKELARYAGEDTLGGYHWSDNKRRWPMGSLFEEEGKVLYALIRAYKPKTIVEIGTLRGCSTAHMATALSVNGDGGHITAIDNVGGAGDLFPKHLDSFITLVTEDGLVWLAGQEDESIDLLFEDSSHGEDMCASVAALCKDKLTPGGLLVVHDAAHDFVKYGDGISVPDPNHTGETIRRGLTRALGAEYRTYQPAGDSDCGFALWQKPATTKAIGESHPEYELFSNGDLNEKHESTPLADVHSEWVVDEIPTDMWYSIDGQHWQNDAHPGESIEDYPLSNLTGQVIVNESGYIIAQARTIEPSEGAVKNPDPEDPRAGLYSRDDKQEVIAALKAELAPPKKKRGRPSKKDKAT